MHKFLLPLLLLAATFATARDFDRDYDNRRFGQRYTPSPAYSRGDPITGTMRDLQYVWSHSRVDGHESAHFRRALSELEDFRRNSAYGRFDRGSLDHAIDNLADLAQAHQIHPRFRSILRDRLHQLRSLRHGGRYGR